MTRAMKNSSVVFWFLAVAVLGVVAITAAVWFYLDRIESKRPAAGEAEASYPTAAKPARPALDQELEIAQRALRTDGLIAISIQRFELRMGRLPAATDELLRAPENLAADEKWTGPYINNPGLLTDPWGSKYEYLSPGIHNQASYDLWSRGADGVSGTDDDVGNW